MEQSLRDERDEEENPSPRLRVDCPAGPLTMSSETQSSRYLLQN